MNQVPGIAAYRRGGRRRCRLEVAAVVLARLLPGSRLVRSTLKELREGHHTVGSARSRPRDTRRLIPACEGGQTAMRTVVTMLDGPLPPP
jgi:hypothetical protein